MGGKELGQSVPEVGFEVVKLVDWQLNDGTGVWIGI